MEIVSRSVHESNEIATQLARRLLALPKRDAAHMVALEGELGAGKTTFVRGLLRAWGITETVKSPTFLLMREYAVGDRRVAHFDCYRISGPEHMTATGFHELAADPNAILLIEWAERIGPLVPADALRVHIDHIGPTERKFTISE